MPKTKKAKPT